MYIIIASEWSLPDWHCPEKRVRLRFEIKCLRLRNLDIKVYRRSENVMALGCQDRRLSDNVMALGCQDRRLILMLSMWHNGDPAPHLAGEMEAKKMLTSLS